MRVLAFIGDYAAAHGYAPTYREIADHCGFVSIKSVRDSLDRLRADGRVTWQDGRTRTLRIVETVS